MVTTKEDLALKSPEEIRTIAETLKIKPHAAATADTMTQQIMQQPQAYIAAAMLHKAEMPIAATIHNTEEAVREAIKAHALVDGFEVKFPDDGTWSFKCRGSEDSGNMSIPLRVIAMKAEMVSRGRRVLKGFKDGSDTVIWG